MSQTTYIVNNTGDSVVWAVEIRNTGSYACHGTIIQFTIGSALTLVSTDVVAPNGGVAVGAYNPTQNKWYVGTLNPGDSGIIVLTFNVNDVDAISANLLVTASAVTSCDESSLADNSWELQVYKDPQCLTNLEISTNTPDLTYYIVKIDDLVCFHLKAKNDSNFVIDDVEVTIDAGAGLEYSSGDTTLPAGTSFLAGVWTIGQLSALQYKECTFCYKVTDDTELPFNITATITSTTPGFCDNDTSDDEVEVEATGTSCEGIRECARRKKVVKITADYVATGDEDYILAYPTDNTIQITLVDPVTLSGVGYAYPVKIKAVNLDNGLSVISAGTGATVDQAPSYVFSNPSEAIELLPDYDDNDWLLF